jgi:DNA-binding XRE family transcriptional regulator
MSRTETPAAKLAVWQGWADEARREADAAAARGDAIGVAVYTRMVDVYGAMMAGELPDYEADPLLCPEGPLIAPDRMAPANPISADDLARVAALLGQATYRFAWTMRWNPHWYTLRRTWPSHAEFDWVQEMILRHGYRSKYGRRWWSTLDVGDFFYWLNGYPIEIEILINRKPLPVEGPPIPKELRPWYKKQQAERAAEASTTRIEPAAQLPLPATDGGGEERPTKTIRQPRHDRGLTQQELGDRAGLPRPVISTYETGRQEPRAATVRRIASALDVTMDAIALIGAHAKGGV